MEVLALGTSINANEAILEGLRVVVDRFSGPHPGLGLFERIQQLRALLLGKNGNLLHRSDGHHGGAAALLLGNGFVRHSENIAPRREIHRCDEWVVYPISAFRSLSSVTGNASTASAPGPDSSSRCPRRRACPAAPASSRTPG